MVTPSGRWGHLSTDHAPRTGGRLLCFGIDLPPSAPACLRGDASRRTTSGVPDTFVQLLRFHASGLIGELFARPLEAKLLRNGKLKTCRGVPHAMRTTEANATDAGFPAYARISPKAGAKESLSGGGRTRMATTKHAAVPSPMRLTSCWT